MFVCQFGLAGSVRFVVPVFTRFSSGESTYSRMFSRRRANNTKRPPTPSTRSTSETVRSDDPVAGSTTVVAVGATVVVEAMVVGVSVVVVVGFAIHYLYIGSRGQRLSHRQGVFIQAKFWYAKSALQSSFGGRVDGIVNSLIS